MTEETIEQLVERIYAENIALDGILTEQEQIALRTLHLCARIEQNPDHIPLIITAVLSRLGYTATIAGHSDQGFPLNTDVKLVGKANLGYLFLMNQTQESLTASQQQFLTIYSEQSGLILDHALYHKKILQQEQRIKGLFQEVEEFQGIAAHEMKGPLTVLFGCVKMLQSSKPRSPEDIASLFTSMENACDQMNDLIKLLYLKGSTKEEIKKQAEFINAEEVLLNNARMYEDYLIDHQLRLVTRISLWEGKPIRVHFNKSVFHVLHTIPIGNAFSYAVPGSVVYVGVKIDHDHLETIVENQDYGTKRKGIGFGKGRGLPFFKKMIGKFDGKVKTSRESMISNDYDQEQHFGNSDAGYQEGYASYAMRIRIPLRELTFHPPEKT